MTWKPIFTYNQSGLSVEIQVFTEDIVLESDIILLDESHRVGSDSAFAPPHLPHEVQLLILDEGNAVDRATRNAKKGTHRVVISHGGTEFFTGYAMNNVDRSDFISPFTRFTLFCTDGLTALQEVDNDYVGFHQLGNLFVNLLDDIGFQLPVNIVMDRQHQGAAPPAGILPNGIRLDVDEYTHIDSQQPSKYNLLIRLLDDYGLQIFQEENEWWIMQRGMRDSSSLTKYRSELGSWTTSAFDPTHIIDSSDLRKDETSRRSWQPLSVAERVFKIPEIDYDLLNSGFDDFTTGIPDHWELAAGSVSELSSSVRLSNKSTRLQQSPERVLRGGDTFSSLYDITYSLDIDPVTNYTVGLFQVIAERLSDGVKFYNAQGTTWTTTPSYFEDTGFSGSNPPATVSVDGSINYSPLPGSSGTVYKITFVCAVDDPEGVLSTNNPASYDVLASSPDSLQNQFTEQVYQAVNNDYRHGVETLQQETGVADLGDNSIANTYEYFDGTDWISTKDWSSETAIQSLAEVTLKDMVEQRFDYRDGFFLRMPADYSILLYETIKFTPFSSQKTFVPLFRSWVRSSGKVQVNLTELSRTTNQPIGAITFNFPYSDPD